MDDLEILRRRLERERAGRKAAEAIAEAKTFALYESNSKLGSLNNRLQELVEERTSELVQARDHAINANRAKSTFLANMSHELRTPLNAIIGYSEMILEEQTDAQPTLLGDVRKIHGAGRHLLALINDVLDLSRVEAGKMAVTTEVVEVAELVAEVVETIEPLRAKKRNHLEVSVTPGVGTLRTDLVKVRQILFNLLSNAIKFTIEGRIELSAWRDEDQRRIYFDVRDSGIGIPPAHMDKLFIPFSQVDETTTRRFGGTGLGLALSQKFCLMLGGEITVESEPGKGSLFRVWLPIDDVADNSVAVVQDTAALPTQPGSTVLVIDDDKSVHDLLTRHLATTGLQVVCTADPRSALTLARQIRPLVITLDVLMPHKDGWSVLADLKADPELKDIPVVLLSILDERGFGFALGAADYLVKPVPRAQLIEVIRRHVNRESSGQLLVVEDDPLLRGLMMRALAAEGWSVVEAENGRVALERLARQTPALILLDLMMPEMDGFEFLTALRRVPAWRDVPVVVVTAKDLTEEDVAFFRTKAHVVLRKGIYEQDELLREVQRAVGRSAASIRPGAMAPNQEP